MSRYGANSDHILPPHFHSFLLPQLMCLWKCICACRRTGRRVPCKSKAGSFRLSSNFRPCHKNVGIFLAGEMFISAYASESVDRMHTPRPSNREIMNFSECQSFCWFVFRPFGAAFRKARSFRIACQHNERPVWQFVKRFSCISLRGDAEHRTLQQFYRAHAQL